MTLVGSAMGSGKEYDPCFMRHFPTDCPESEHHQTENCCVLIPCCLCISLTYIYDDITYHADACWDEVFKEYRGTIELGGGTEFDFTFTWEKDEYNQCFHVVTFDGEEVVRIEHCECENIAGSVETGFGLLEWERQVKHIRKPWDKGCETSCPECRCVADIICATWLKTGINCPQPCLESILKLEWDCADSFGPVIFEPDCCGDELPVSLAIRQTENEYEECVWQLIVDGAVRDEVDGNEGHDCIGPELSFAYTDDDGCEVTVTTDGRKCGCLPPYRQICCCPDRDDVPDKLYVQMFNRSECECVDEQVVEIDLTNFCVVPNLTGVGATWEGDGAFCVAGPYDGPGFHECQIRIFVECLPSPTCAWQLNFCTGSGDGCGDLETACATPTGALPGGTCGGSSSTSCDPLRLVFAASVNSDNCCCNPSIPSSDFCFVVTEEDPR